ncbi:MAG: hypothetical protein A3I29_04755 [Candidatus Magasanikbacteria bacterium RIFCSPLOWO2_02_FULL_44_11]|uniref:PEGA domain-containing protein n=1 Tax=Candidatus Magasanikbacteria bacterium RIFCSPLOWO2_02_FULL_44_11 TaxID=1798689 RepID=A0A1F6N979_9BACT|nr:MAG: hypothetical protein A3I29_04755 [Candidatus Magasanikbacteria bacterium RIFCSPLOWO2_02_FULL_44_11]
MEYPGAHLIKPIRRLILVTFIVAFFLITPLMLLYTTGYRYDWKAGIIRETGGLSIDATPVDADVYLNDLPLDSSLPIRLKNITPKKYHIKISARGYFDWEKEIIVERKQTTYIKDIQLLKKTQAMLYEIRSGKTILLGSTAKDTPVSFFWSNKHPFLAAAFGQNTFQQIVTVNSENTTEISAITGHTITRLLWRETSEPVLYLSTSSSLSSFYPRLREERPIIKNNFRDWYIANGTLWTLSKATSTNLEIISDELGFHGLFATVSSTDNSYKISDYFFKDIRANHAVLENGRGEMIIIRPDKQFTLNVTSLLVSPYNSWWLLWNDVELWSYIEGENPFLFHRSGNSLKKVIPLDKFNTLALLFENEIKVLYPYAYTQITLLQKDLNDIAANPEIRQLYFSTNDGLYSLAY